MGDELKLFDGRRAWEICDGDSSLFLSLVQIYSEASDEMREGVKSALDGPAQQLEDAIHKIKGSLRNLACPRVVALLQSAEEAAKAGNIDTARELWHRAVPILDETSQFLVSGGWKDLFGKS